MISRPLAIFVVALFAVLIGAPVVAWMGGVESGGSSLENRALAPRPPLTVESLSSGEWGTKFSDWVWDTVPLRDRLLLMDHWIDWHVLGDSPLPAEIIRSDDDWAFRRERVTGSSAGGVSPARLMKALDRIEAAFDDAGVRFLFVVSPNKPTIHAEHLPPRYRAANEATVKPTVDALRQRAAADPRVLDLWQLLEREKERRRGDSTIADERLRPVFRAHDDHWSLEAGRVQAEALVSGIEPGRFDARYAPRNLGNYVEAESELSRVYLKIGSQEPYALVEQSPLIDLTVKRTRVGNNTVSTFTSRPRGDFVPSALHVRVLRDSFLSAAPREPGPTNDAGMETIAPFFTETRFIHWNSLAEDTAAAERSFLGADVVVIQVTQGNLKNVLAHEQKLIAVAKKLRKKT